MTQKEFEFPDLDLLFAWNTDCINELDEAIRNLEEILEWMEVDCEDFKHKVLLRIIIDSILSHIHQAHLDARAIYENRPKMSQDQWDILMKRIAEFSLTLKDLKHSG